MGKGLKLPFWDRVPKNRFLKMPFDFFLNRVASGGARWDPITLLAKEHIGITSYEKCMARPNLELATRAQKKSALTKRVLPSSAGEPQRVLHAMAAMLPRQR